MTETRAPDEVSPRGTASPLKAGDLVGDYEILGEHARGGLGRILRARDRRLNRVVALKVPVREDDLALARFAREARLTARLQHPAIIPVYDEGVLPAGQHYYTMMLVDGRPLRDVLAGAPDLSSRLALVPIATAAAEAIAYAHARGIIHRDIKPSNLLVSSTGEAVVIDWGLAKTLDEGEEPEPTGPHRGAETLDGSVLGTPAYMPPEQALGEPVDRRADVYSLGALLYHLLAGRPPYEGEPAEILAKVASRAPRPLGQVNRELPRDLEAIVAQAMARAPADRYPDAAAMASDLERFQAGQLVSARRYSRLARLARWARRHRTILALAAILTATLVTIAVRSYLEIRRQAAVARASAAELMLAHAARAVEHDPTEALAWLLRYPPDGPAWRRVRDIATDAESRGIARHVLVHGHPLIGVALADEDQTISAVDEGATRVAWDAESGRRVASPASPETQTRALATSRDGRWTAEARADHAIELRDKQSGAVRELRGHRAAVTAVVFDGASRRLVSTSRDGTARVWLLPSSDGRAVFRHGAGVALAEPVPGTPRLVTVSDDRSVALVDLASGQTRVLTTLANPPLALEVTDGGTVAVAGEAPRLVYFSPADDYAVHELTVAEVPLSLASATGRERIAALGFNTLTLVDPERHAVSEPIEPRSRKDGGVNWTLQMSPDGDEVAITGWARAPELFALDRDQSRYLRGHEDNDIMDLRYSPDGRVVATSGADGTVRIWDRAQARERHRYDLGNPVSLHFVRNELLTARHEEHLVVIDLAGHRQQRFLAPAAITGIASTADGGRVAAATADGRVWLLDPHSGRSRIFRGAAPARGLTFVSNDTALVSGSGDGTVWAWPLDLEASPEAGARLPTWIATRTSARIRLGNSLGTPGS